MTQVGETATKLKEWVINATSSCTSACAPRDNTPMDSTHYEKIQEQDESKTIKKQWPVKPQPLKFMRIHDPFIGHEVYHPSGNHELPELAVNYIYRHLNDIEITPVTTMCHPSLVYHNELNLPQRRVVQSSYLPPQSHLQLVDNNKQDNVSSTIPPIKYKRKPRKRKSSLNEDHDIKAICQSLGLNEEQANRMIAEGTNDELMENIHVLSQVGNIPEDEIKKKVKTIRRKTKNRESAERSRINRIHTLETLRTMKKELLAERDKRKKLDRDIKKIYDRKKDYERKLQTKCRFGGHGIEGVHNHVNMVNGIIY